MRSVRSRTVFTIVLLIVLALLIGVIFCLTFANRYYIRLKGQEMQEIYDCISSLYDDEDRDEHFWEHQNNTKEYREGVDRLIELCDQTSISLFIQDPAGEAVFTYGNPIMLSSRLNELTFDIGEDRTTYTLEQKNEYIIQTINEKDSDKTEYIEMWGILDSQNSFLARAPFSGIETSIKAAIIFFFFILIVILIIAAIIIYILVSSYSRPLKELVVATQNASNMDFSDVDSAINKNKKKRYDELGVLGENISEMSKKLEKTVSELKSSNLKLTNELKAKAELEEQRKKYISDISHELKTPIALISGYAEGLKEGIGGTKEDQDYYLDVILDETEKMNLMVKRISSLNKLEQGHGDVELQRFNVVEVINGYLNTMALILDENDINVLFNDKDIIYVWSDEFLFEEVLMNYLNNALNHVDQNKTISIKVEPLENTARVTVFNTGQHIPEEDIEKVWGEFYKVDKARTREYGGSGLGLSIVKAIAETLNQECGVYNTENGVAFWIDLELDKVQEYGKTELEKRSNIKISDLPVWKTTTKILKSTSSRFEASAKERAVKDQQRREIRARKEAQKKEEKAIKEAQKKDELQKQKETKRLKKEKNKYAADK